MLSIHILTSMLLFMLCRHTVAICIFDSTKTYYAGHRELSWLAYLHKTLTTHHSFTLTLTGIRAASQAMAPPKRARTIEEKQAELKRLRTELQIAHGGPKRRPEGDYDRLLLPSPRQNNSRL